MTAATLADLLPAPHFSERHARRIAAPPPAVWAALHELRLGDLRVSNALMGVRSLPARLTGAGTSRMLTGRLLDGGPVPVLASDPGRAVVAGGVMQPWKLFGGEDPPPLDVAGLKAFDTPGWVKVGIDFVLEPDRGGTTLRTETRVVATDARTRARFGLYWLFVRLGSGVIRLDMLRAVARHAERPAP